ncbi:MULTISPECIES: PDR/VanB family oxidoreductase [unclassified Luteococcus]|uniref:PDR/VanB family oxidoreductase n=1 Tax=unclassified Luteococcus TaxID=2639923 RepID=UPI00313F05EF
MTSQSELPGGVLEVRVLRCEDLAVGVRRLTFERTDGSDFPAWEPGSHIDVIMPDHVRQYSICSSPAQLGQLQVSVLRVSDSRGGSAWVHDGLQEGQQITISAPRNNFVFQDSRKYLFIAGGIGITPIVPMLERAEQLGREWTLVYCGRSRSTMAFLPQLEERYPGRVKVYPADESGRVNLADHLALPRAKMLIYSCGPVRLIEEIEDWARGWPPGVLHTERFTAATLDAGASMDPFEVELVRTGRTVEVNTDQTVLEALEGVGTRILSSCRAGVCGTCETEVISGEVDHRDVVLSDEEKLTNQSMMVCVSRAANGCARLRLNL